MEQLADLKYKRAGRYASGRASLFRKHYQLYREDKEKMIIHLLNKYGINYRDLHNFTPLHAAAFAGAVDITKMLLRNGAGPGLLDTFLKTPLQIALEQALFKEAKVMKEEEERRKKMENTLRKKGHWR